MAGAMASSQRAVLSQDCALQCCKGRSRLENTLLVAAKPKNVPCEGSAGLPVPLKHQLPGRSSSTPTAEPHVLCPVSG